MMSNNNSNNDHDVEDILSDALELIDDDAAKDARFADEERVQYGDLILRVAPKEGKQNLTNSRNHGVMAGNYTCGILKALTLLADQLFLPSLVLAERIEQRLIHFSGRSVLELGAGCAVPSLLSATLPPSEAPSLVVITDYPDTDIITNLRGNVEANRPRLTEGCTVRVEGYEWGDASVARKLRSILPEGSLGYDTLILSDLLHFDASHELLLDSVCALISPKPVDEHSHSMAITPQVHVAAGRYTPPSVCADFLHLGEVHGFKWTEIALHDVDSTLYTWKGTLSVSHPLGRVLTGEELAARKENCRYWIGEWA